MHPLTPHAARERRTQDDFIQEQKWGKQKLIGYCGFKEQIINYKNVL